MQGIGQNSTVNPRIRQVNKIQSREQKSSMAFGTKVIKEGIEEIASKGLKDYLNVLEQIPDNKETLTISVIPGELQDGAKDILLKLENTELPNKKPSITLPIINTNDSGDIIGSIAGGLNILRSTITRMLELNKTYEGIFTQQGESRFKSKAKVQEYCEKHFPGLYKESDKDSKVIGEVTPVSDNQVITKPVTDESFVYKIPEISTEERLKRLEALKTNKTNK